jgi:hypothetical protein
MPAKTVLIVENQPRKNAGNQIPEKQITLCLDLKAAILNQRIERQLVELAIEKREIGRLKNGRKQNPECRNRKT